MIELKFFKERELISEEDNIRKFIFPYNLTDLEQGLGSDNEEKEIIVSISKDKIQKWNYKNDNDLIKVLYEFALAFIKEKILSKNLFENEYLDIPNTKKYDERPYDPDLIEKYPPPPFCSSLNYLGKNKK
jgi:hypothetical protein